MILGSSVSSKSWPLSKFSEMQCQPMLLPAYKLSMILLSSKMKFGVSDLAHKSAQVSFFLLNQTWPLLFRFLLLYWTHHTVSCIGHLQVPFSFPSKLTLLCHLILLWASETQVEYHLFDKDFHALPCLVLYPRQSLQPPYACKKTLGQNAKPYSVSSIHKELCW